MNTSSPNVTVIGCGGMARHHLTQMLRHFPQTRVPVICEPSPAMFEQMSAIFQGAGHEVPFNEPDLRKLLAAYGPQLDAAFILTPHAYHHDQTLACMEAGLDVLLEKPMVMSASEAQSLIDASQRLGRMLVVAFQGGLSPNVQAASAMVRNGQIGRLLNIDGLIWQNWEAQSRGTWRQAPELSGGGFFFDTGAHLLNTVAELAGEPFVEVAAWLDNQGRPVDISGVVMGRLRSGALVTLNACGNTSPSCASEIRVLGSEGMLRTGAWGEFLEVQTDQQTGWLPVDVPASLGVWEQFLLARSGRIANPSPPSTGLRMAHLWDAIRASAARGGAPVSLPVVGAANPAPPVPRPIDRLGEPGASLDS